MNRQPPLFEFNQPAGAGPHEPVPGSPGLVPPQIPGYLDSLGNSPPDGARERSDQLLCILQRLRQRRVRSQRREFRELRRRLEPQARSPSLISASVSRFRRSRDQPGLSPAPNPYTSTTTVPATGVTSFLNPQTFQIISSGLDGLYGVGGQYSPDTGGIACPSTHPTLCQQLRTQPSGIRERDNLTNFHNGKLE